MAGNSNERKKALIVSMLLFLVSGGGVFLFFVVQGSNDLIGKGKEFSYGAAAREGVSSFFKYIGGASSEEEKPYTSEAGKIRAEAKGLLGDSPKAEAADISDWMAPQSKPSAAPTNVPRMGGGGLSGAGGIGGGGGSRSSGGVSRFGEGSGLGNTKIGGAAASDTGTTDKGTLSALRKANTALGQGLNSGSAMTARAKWGSGFGEGSGKGGNLAYAGGGLVSLDKIKKGQVGNLKASYAAKPSVPDATPFERDKGAESKDANLNKVKQDAADAAAKAAKQAMAQSLANAAASGVGGTANQGNNQNNQNGNVVNNPDGSTTFNLTPEQMANATGSTCSSAAPCVNAQGGTLNDTTASVYKAKDGSMTIEFKGTVTYPGQDPQPNREVWTMEKDGKLGKQIFP